VKKMRFKDYSKWILNEVKETTTFTLLNVIGVWISVWVVIVFLSLAVGVEQATITQITDDIDLFTLEIKSRSENTPLPYVEFVPLTNDPRVQQIVPVFADYLRIGALNDSTVDIAHLKENTLIIYTENYFTSDGSGQDQRTTSLDFITGRRLNGVDKVGIIVSDATFRKLSSVVPELSRSNYIDYPLGIVVKRYNEAGDEEYNRFECHIVGITETTPYDSILTYLATPLAEQINDWKNFRPYKNIDYRQRQYERIDFVTYNLDALSSLRKQLSDQAYPTSSILDRIDNVRQVLDVIRIVFFLIFSIAILVAVFNIVITLTSSVLKRKQEIGILKSLGATDLQVQAIFILHAVYLSVFGSVLGAITAYIIITIIRRILLNFKTLAGMELFKINLFSVILVILTAVVLSVLASFAPARKAATITPIDTLRET
jgi:ABC-type lipoprotein release transport system permease subunit